MITNCGWIKGWNAEYLKKLHEHSEHSCPVASENKHGGDSWTAVYNTFPHSAMLWISVSFVAFLFPVSLLTQQILRLSDFLSFSPRTQMQFDIEHTWDSNPVNHDPLKITFSPGLGGLKVEVSGPFFNDPAAPAGPPSQAFPGLWNYEGG